MATLEQILAAQQTLGDKLGQHTKALGELSSLVATGSQKTERLAVAVDELADRVTKVETIVEERTRSIVREDTVRRLLLEQKTECMGARLDRQQRKPSLPPRSNGDKAKLAGVLGGAGAGLAAVGYAIYQLVMHILSSGGQ